mgnify:FL=1
MQEGEGVDAVVDMTADFERVSSALGNRVFGAILCMSVLEHCTEPFRLCANISRLLRPGGVLLVSAPFAWRVHGYPSDYWRFTPDGIRALFTDLSFDMTLSSMSTSVVGEVAPIAPSVFRIEMPQHGNLFVRVLLYLLAKCGHGKFKQCMRYPYLFPPAMMNMHATKP